MKILYGVQCTGNGHISRSREVVSCLKQAGHQVRVILSGRRADQLREMETFAPYKIFPGLTFVVANGRLDYLATAARLKLFQLQRDISAYDPQDAELVISDFEPISARVARRWRIPSIGIGHQYAFCHDIPKPGANFFTMMIMQKFAAVDLPLGLHWHHYGQPILPPIVPLGLGNEPEKPGKVLVYLPWESTSAISEMLGGFLRHSFYIYHGVTRASVTGNLHFRPISRHAFLSDLADCCGVICNAGFELPSEALHLGKKLLIKPLAGQFEQRANATALEELGQAMVMEKLDKGMVAEWLRQPGPVPRNYPQVAALIAEWVSSGEWRNSSNLVARAWQECGEPAPVLSAQAVV